MALSLLQSLEQRVLVYDGAMGTQLQAAGLDPDDFVYEGRILDGCNEILNLTRPDIVEKVHKSYLDAGADLIETNTFGCTAIVLAEYGIPELTHPIAFSAGKIAVKAAREASTPEKPRYAVGALGPGTKLVSLGQTTWEELESTYYDALVGLIEAGVDALLLETLQDLLMVKAVVVAANRAMEDTGRVLPLFIQVTMEQTGTMLLGSELAAALNTLEAFPSVTAIGINCATGPKEMAQHVRFLSENSTRPISVLPNAGLPVMEAGCAVYKLTPDELADYHDRFTSEYGAALVGGCCGTTPEHIRAVAARVGGRPHGNKAHWQKVRTRFPGFDFHIHGSDQASALKLVGCSSLYSFQPYHQDTSFLIVGEKTNANGSKAFREMLAAENWEGLTELARELEGEGSHVLDVCAAYVGRNEVRDMKTLLARYNRAISVPIMIDSTEAEVIEAALQTVAGKPIVNSINLEDGGARLERVLNLCTKYGAAVVALTIDEQGMAKSADHKLEVAEQLLELTRSHGLPDHDVFIDMLTFTLGSGDEEFRPAAVETIEAIRRLRLSHPSANTILGVSNISFGLRPAARLVLNSAFLHYALEAGLTSAIVHFSKIRPENQIDPEIWRIASDLVYDRREFSAV